MKIIFTLLMLLSAQSLIANDTIPTTKVTHKFGGRIDVQIYTDSYQNVDSHNGLQYYFPSQPVYNSEGQDINYKPQLRMGVAPSRFHYTMNANDVMGANVKGYIEVDFMGANENVLSSIRMRHVYFNMQWKTRSLLFGQTSHLTMPDEVASNTVTFGGGFSIYPLNRPVQAQFRQNFGKNANLTVAASMFGGAIGTMQKNASLPDFQARLTAGDPTGFIGGVVGGVKFLKPRTNTPDGVLTKANLTVFNAGAFARYTFPQGYSLRLYGLWGQDLSSLSIIGGYAPLEADRDKDDFGYAPISAVSTLFDFDSPVFKKGLQFGLFAGWQKNLGTTEEVNLSLPNAIYRHIPNFGINSYWRVAPRVYYHYKTFLSFGLEYMISGSEWATEMDNKYRPTDTQTSRNHRVTFLARFKF